MIKEKRDELISIFSSVAKDFTKLFDDYKVYRDWLTSKGKANTSRGREIRKMTVSISKRFKEARRIMLELEEELKK